MPKTKYYYDGKYYQQKVRRSENPADGYITVRAKTVSEMDQKLSDLNFQRRSGAILGNKTTVAEWIVVWWRNRADSFSPSVCSYWRPMLNHVIAPAIGSAKVSSIKAEDIQQIIGSVAEKSKSYHNKLYQLLRRLFRDARANGLIAIDPVETVRPAGIQGEEKEALTEEQFSKLCEATKDTRAYLFCMIGYYTGMRKEEICGLTWDDVYLDDKTPYIEVTHATTWPTRGAPNYPSQLKTKNSRRKIPIHAALIDPLKEAKEASSGNFVIAARDGGALSYMSLRRLWGIVDDRTLETYLPKSRVRSYRKADQKSGNAKKPNREKTIDFYCTPHMLRHTFATNLIASGMDIKKVQYLTGHADITVLLKIYAHVKQNQPAEMVDLLNAAM